MFLESITGTSRAKLETTCEALNADVKKKQQELDLKEKQISRLSKNLRKWTRKYNELELSISETVIETFNTQGASEAHEEETKHLQMMLIKLNKKNTKLEKRLEKMAALLEKASSAPDNLDNKQETESVTLIDSDNEELSPEFPPEFKKVLDHYAETTPAG